MTFYVYGHFYDHIYEPFKEERLYFSGFMKAVGATAVAYLHNIVTNMQVSSAFLGRFTVCFSVVKPRPGATAADESGVSIWSGLFNSLPHGQPSAKTKTLDNCANVKTELQGTILQRLELSGVPCAANRPVPTAAAIRVDLPRRRGGA